MIAQKIPDIDIIDDKNINEIININNRQKIFIKISFIHNFV